MTSENCVLRIETPWPPSINHYWRRVGAKTLISSEGRRFRKQVIEILAAMRIKPMAGELAVEIDAWPPDHRRRDIDNVQKALLDALEHGGAFNDDKQIVRLSIAKRQRIPGGKAEVRLFYFKDSDSLF